MLNVLIFYKFCIDSCTWKSLLTPKYLAVVTNYYALNQPQPKPNNNDYFSPNVCLMSQEYTKGPYLGQVPPSRFSISPITGR